MPIFRGFVVSKIENGSTTLFWKDLWMEDVYSEKFPEPSPLSPMRMFQCRIS
jgi:hypothetical protein